LTGAKRHMSEMDVLGVGISPCRIRGRVGSRAQEKTGGGIRRGGAGRRCHLKSFFESSLQDTMQRNND